MAVATQTASRRGSDGRGRARRRGLATAQGADDRRRLRRSCGQEFDDISISKIRYLEDQKLLAPRRTQGGYRLYSQADVERLRAILRMQRDEFLPLRVIRQELAAGRFARCPSRERGGRDPPGGFGRRAGRRP